MAVSSVCGCYCDCVNNVYMEQSTCGCICGMMCTREWMCSCGIGWDSVLWPSGPCRVVCHWLPVSMWLWRQLYLGLSVSQCLEQMLEGTGKAAPSSLLLFPGQCPAVLCHQGSGLHPSLVSQQCCPTPPGSRLLLLYIPSVLAASMTQPPALC